MAHPSIAAPARRAALINTLVVALGYLVSRVLGIIRDIIVNAQFGTSPAIGAYQAAFQIPDLLYLVIMGGALGSAFIPVFSGFLAEDQRSEAWRLGNGVLNMALILMIAMAALVAWQADLLIGLIYRDFDGQQRALTVSLLRLLLVQPVLLGIGGLAKAMLESFDRFSIPALGSNLYNIGAIIGALLFAPFFGVYGLVWGIILGAALFLLVQIPALIELGYRYTANFNVRTAGLLRVAWLMAPRVFGQSAWQIGLIVASGITASFGAGAVRANGIALQLMLLPHGLIALSLGTVIFPRLSRAYAAGDTTTLRQESIGAIRNVLFLALPAAVILYTLPVPVIRLLFERFKFSAESTAITAELLRNYAIGLAAFAAAEIIVRTFYAMQDTLTPVLAGVFTVALNITLASMFVRLNFGLGGVGLAFSIAAIAEAIVLLLILWWRWRTLEGLWSALGRMALSGAAFAALLIGLLRVSTPLLPALAPTPSYAWLWDIIPLGVWFGAALLLGGGLYGGLAALLGLPEASAVLARLQRLTRR